MEFIPSLKKYLEEQISAQALGEASIVLAASDGVLIYSSEQLNARESAGPLMCGAWQAAMALTDQGSGENFRFSFDTTSSGVHVLSLEIGDKQFYLGCIFEGVLNIGQLKVRLRYLKESIEQKFAQNSFFEDQESVVMEENYLFSNVSDNEINNLFAFVEE